MELQREQADFYRTQVSAYNSAYKNFSDIQKTLNEQFAPILAAGPGQMGFTPEELSDLTTVATEGTAAQYAKAQKAMQQGQAARGGGTSNINMTSGGAEDERARMAAFAASQSAAQRLQIRATGYDVGRQQWQQAVAGEEDLAAGWNPNAFAGSATSAGKVASDTASNITKESQSAWGSVLGALGGIAGNVSSPSVGGWKLG
ncbi:MAG TPA: hypothetical protein VGH83_01130 [Candidatus Acidoferrum sp.]|jgi:hypothetical protein